MSAPAAASTGGHCVGRVDDGHAPNTGAARVDRFATRLTTRSVTTTTHVSLSRVRRRDQCELADWWATTGAHGGWRPDAPVEVRVAHALKGLTSVPAVLGVGIHDAFARITRALRDGRRPPAYEELYEGMRGRLNAAARNRDVGGWLADDRRGPLLREVLLGEWPEGRPPVAIVEATQARAAGLLRRLLSHPVLADLAACGRGDILACDSLEATLVEMVGVPVRVYAAPDVAYISRARIELPDVGVPLPAGTAVIADVKSGRVGDRIEAARSQLQVYAWYAVTHLGVRYGPTGCIAARVVDLSARTPGESDVWWAFGPADVEQGRRTLERCVEGIAAQQDATGMIDRDRVSRTPTACRWCNWSVICANPELAPPAWRQYLDSAGARESGDRPGL
ncbi:PD-(D/E)XK nuclease family protein [Gemmatirosa kalamazoonensis]|uniref:PD-(D/E)XK nuclease family protein n=1 Tax=Gemmatirosa kalamazoonensis TaxID=861299 RepID=UPI0011DE0CE2|nr:PD-(D/E)XK nuclease family protein [Gemmatirosa kalamazoonensis]